MSLAEEIRGELRGGRAKLAAKAAPAWRPPEIADFQEFRYVLAFDATLTNCGWVFFIVKSGAVGIIDKGTIKPRTDHVSYMGTWEKGRQLDVALTAMIGQTGIYADIVVEAPSVGGGSRTESSLIAGMLVRNAAPADCSVVSATHVSAVLLGDAKIRSAARKPAIREAVIRLCPETARGWNEHERDALATGLVHLHDVKQGEK